MHTMCLTRCGTRPTPHEPNLRAAISITFFWAHLETDAEKAKQAKKDGWLSEAGEWDEATAHFEGACDAVFAENETLKRYTTPVIAKVSLAQSLTGEDTGRWSKVRVAYVFSP